MPRIISLRFKVARTSCGAVPVLCTPRNVPTASAANRAAAIQGENGEGCFLTHLVVRSACGRQRPGTEFFHALSCRRSDWCRPSLCRVSLLFEENAGDG